MRADTEERHARQGLEGTEGPEVPEVRRCDGGGDGRRPRLLQHRHAAAVEQGRGRVLLEDGTQDELRADAPRGHVALHDLRLPRVVRELTRRSAAHRGQANLPTSVSTVPASDSAFSTIWLILVLRLSADRTICMSCASLCTSAGVGNSSLISASVSRVSEETLPASSSSVFFFAFPTMSSRSPSISAQSMSLTSPSSR